LNIDRDTDSSKNTSVFNEDDRNFRSDCEWREGTS